MKKMTFALACASTLALFAVDPISFIDFESYTEVPFTGLTEKTDTGASDGATSSKWLYKAGSGSEDASTVKKYGEGENLAAPTGTQLSGTPGNNYLELSTEGGTLWRSINNLTTPEGATAELGETYSVGADGLYIDTMVQFTPTEDGGTPEVVKDVDKLAIWLNVDSASNTTNLMVRCGTLITEGSGMLLNYKDGGAANFVLDAGTVVPGEWYRLTVKVIGLAATSYVGGMQHFMIYLDGVALTCKDGANPFDASFISAKVWDANSQTVKDSALSEDVALAIAAGKVFPSLAYSKTVAATLQGVGFKGSGAIDDLVFTTSVTFEGEDTTVPVEGITLDASRKEITLNGTAQTFQLTATVTPDGATNKGVAWESDNAKVTVSDAGLVTVAADATAGTAQITVKSVADDTKFATCVVTLKAAEPQPTDQITPATPVANPESATETPDLPPGYPSYATEGDTAPAQATRLNKFTAWISTGGAAAGVTVQVAAANEDAFLLNVAPNAEAVEAAKAAFKIPSITIDANGKPLPAEPTKEGGFNGVLEMQGSETVNGQYAPKSGADWGANIRFFKAILK